MTGRGKKQKGKRGEREAADVLRSFGWQAKRGMSFLGEPDIVTNFPMHVEVKYQERLNIFAALAQAEQYVIDKKQEPHLYSVFFRKNDGEWYAAIPLRNLLCMASLTEAVAKLNIEGKIELKEQKS